MTDMSPPTTATRLSRRALLAGGAGAFVALSGCAGLGDSSSDPPTLDRILLRSDTGTEEPLRLTLVYAPQDDSTRRPIWGTYEAPASGDPLPIRDFEGDPGFYSLTAHSPGHDNLEVASFNSYGDGVGSEAVQFEVVVKQSGDVWLNVDRAGEQISIPDYDG